MISTQRAMIPVFIFLVFTNWWLYC